MMNTNCIEKRNHTLDNVFENLFEGFTVPQFRTSVPVNIKENKDEFLVEVVAPGFEKNDFKINLEDKMLTISAETKNENKEENTRTVKSEYVYRSFKRSFTLDDNINADAIKAQYNNGVLNISLPKKPEVKPDVKEIAIN